MSVILAVVAKVALAVLIPLFAVIFVGALLCSGGAGFAFVRGLDPTKSVSEGEVM